MSNQQPRQFAPRNPNSNQKPNFNNNYGKNFAPRQNKEGFNPERIQEKRNKPRSNNNFHYNYNDNNNNSNSTNTNSNASNKSNANTKESNVPQTSSQNSNIVDNNQNNINSNVNNVDNNSNSKNNSNPTSNENNDEKEQLPPIQCPLCNEKKFKFYSECIYHIVKVHNCQSMIQKNIVGNCQCKYCGKLLTIDDEFIVQHMFDYHREEFFASFTDGPVRKNDRYKKLKNYFRKVLTVKEEPRIIRKVIPSQYNVDEEEDEDYVNFIASSIHTNGLSSFDEVKIQNVQPIENPNSQPKTEIIDHNFWVKLNNITERLSNSGQIQTNENHYYCFICKKGFDSHVRLLSHCWNKHQNH